MVKAKKGATFVDWRQRVGLTQLQAAEALGVSISQVKNWESGLDRSRGTPAAPPYAARVLMWAIAEGIEFKAWGG